MTIEQLIAVTLAWVSGPTFSAVLSATLEKYSPFGFGKWTRQGKAVFITVATSVIGYAAWYISAHIPATLVAQLDPTFVQLFPFLSWASSQVFHWLQNRNARPVG